MQFGLSHENEHFLGELVSQGKFTSPAAALDEAVALLRRREKLRADVQLAIDEIECGQGEAHNMEDIRAEVRSRRSAEGR